MPSTIFLWYRNNRGDVVPIPASKTLWFGVSKPILGEKAAVGAVAICPIESRAGYIGVAAVPDELAGQVTLCGNPLWAGMHALRHADRLVVNGQSVWIAANFAFEAVAYDPAVHGEDLRCFISKARLSPGQEIVCCPGTPGHPCGQIYAKTSWGRAMQSQAQMRCANCGFHPDAADWRPPDLQSSRTIDDILKNITNAA